LEAEKAISIDMEEEQPELQGIPEVTGASKQPETLLEKGAAKQTESGKPEAVQETREVRLETA
jgi:hypothetical protein